MVNSIYSYLVTEEAQGVIHIEDIVAYGVEEVAPGGLIHNEDIVDFFDKNLEDIEAVIFEFVEDLANETFYDIVNIELMELLNDYTNLEFTTNDEMLELISEEAFKRAEVDYAEEWDDMDEYEVEELIFDYMEHLEVLPTEQDKLNFVWLAVELVAQDIIEERK